MNYTPLDIRHQEFPKRMNGYDPAAVRAFLVEVAEQIEQLLMQQQAQGEFLQDLEQQLEDKRASEDEIRRAVIAAERISHELRENAVRETETMLAQATSQREALLSDLESRAREFEAQHEARMATLESAFRTRGAELERQFHQVLLERERAQAERLSALDQAYLERHSEYTARLSGARQEYAQFVSGYRAMAASFADMAARHIVPEAQVLLGTHPLPDAPELPSLPRTVNSPSPVSGNGPAQRHVNNPFGHGPAGVVGAAAPPISGGPQRTEAPVAQAAAPSPQVTATSTPPAAAAAPSGTPAPQAQTVPPLEELSWLDEVDDMSFLEAAPQSDGKAPNAAPAVPSRQPD